MSATSIRVDGDAASANSSLPLAEGNRVLESIAHQDGLNALLAFSGLHERIRNHHFTADPPPERDFSQTERFFLDEVLQLICNRAQALTGADAVMVALDQGLGDGSELICRASTGQLPVPRGIRLHASGFLEECLATGKTLRCDDARTDPRSDRDLARILEAPATVLVPLRGRSQCLGLLQAFSTAPWSFTDDDVRCLELFAELLLAALRPEDQDRRFQWLADVADDILQVSPLPVIAPRSVAPTVAAAPAPPVETPMMAAETAATDDGRQEINWREMETAEPAIEEEIPAEIPVFAEPARTAPAPEFRLHSSESEPEANVLSAHPGLSVVMGLIAVAALFSAGVWWGMQFHGKASSARSAEEATATQLNEEKKGVSNLVPASSAGSTAGNTAPNVSDNLLDPVPAPTESALSPVPANKLAALPKITAVRHWSSSMGSTVVIDMEDQVPYEVHRLMSPERIYFDLHDTALAADLEGKTMDVGDPSLSRVRIAQPVAGVTRVVLDTKGSSNFSVSLETDPYRLIIELRDLPKTLVATKSAPALPATSSEKNVRTQAAVEPTPIKTGKFRIVLDAGHGGWDLGTVGRQGLVEKDLVLDVTQRLGRLLHDRLGSDVMFTRTTDDYLPLEQRADFANHAQADLFISVHANYSSSVSARGVETYYTNLFAAPGSKEVDKQSGNAAQVTPASLSPAGLHEKTEESRRLAATVQRSLYSTLASKSPDIRDRGIKDAAFVVLTGTTMPAILTEISFVSSPTDEHNLQSEAYRQQIAEALFKGIARYQESSPRARVAQLQPVVRR
jgi:N-acetylmuramoyl-L-alanine amidase